MNRFLARANRKLPVSLAAGLLSGSALVSSVLGLLRSRILLAHFGLGSAMDAYQVAFTIPDFMFYILVSGALSVTFIPVFNERMAKGNKKSAWELSSSLINFMALITMVASVFIMIFADPLVRYVVAPGLDEQTNFLAVSMMRIIAINPFLFAISSVMASMQQATGRFFFFALAPSLYNLGIIVGVQYISPHAGIMGAAYGVAIGSVVQLLTSSLGMWKMGFDYRSKIFWKNLGFRKVLSLLPPRSLDQGIDYFNTLVETNLASRLRIGSIAAYQSALNLYMVPITLIGVAISTAAFPKMSERLGQGRPDLFRKELQVILRVIIWLAMPTAVITFFCRGYLVRLLVANGNSTIAALLGLLVVAILFRSMYQIASRSFYAQQDTRTPLYISIAAIGLNILLAIILARPQNLGIYGLAVAQSLVAVFEVTVLLVVLVHRFPKVLDMVFANAVLRMVSASGLMGICTYAFVSFFFPLRAGDTGFMVLVPKFGIIVTLSMLAYFFFSAIFRLTEVQPVIQRSLRVIFRSIKL
jgi:putative peptidoglycan lipid II flippase